VVRERGPDHEKIFEVELAIRRQMQGMGAGKSKKEAEQDAARKVLAGLRTRELLTTPRDGAPDLPDND
jgi:ribonuclease-3